MNDMLSFCSACHHNGFQKQKTNWSLIYDLSFRPAHSIKDSAEQPSLPRQCRIFLLHIKNGDKVQTCINIRDVNMSITLQIKQQTKKQTHGQIVLPLDKAVTKN